MLNKHISLTISAGSNSLEKWLGKNRGSRILYISLWLQCYVANIKSNGPVSDSYFHCMFQVSKQPGCSSEGTEDSVLLQLQQLSLPQYCLLCLFHTVPHLGPSSGSQRQNPALLAAELVHLFAMCVKPNIWSSTDPVAQEVSQHLKQVLVLVGDVLEKYRYWLNNQSI